MSGPTDNGLPVVKPTGHRAILEIKFICPECNQQQWARFEMQCGYKAARACRNGGCNTVVVIDTPGAYNNV